MTKAIQLAALMAAELKRQGDEDQMGSGYVSVNITVDESGVIDVDREAVIDGHFDLVKLAEMVITEVRSDYE